MAAYLLRAAFIAWPACRLFPNRLQAGHGGDLL